MTRERLTFLTAKAKTSPPSRKLKARKEAKLMSTTMKTMKTTSPSKMLVVPTLMLKMAEKRMKEIRTMMTMSLESPVRMRMQTWTMALIRMS